MDHEQTKEMQNDPMITHLQVQCYKENDCFPDHDCGMKGMT